MSKAAVKVSDNPAANILISEMGGRAAFQQWYRSIGDQVTRVDRMEAELNSALPGDMRDTTTAEQYVANLDHVLRGNLLSAAHLQLLVRWITWTRSRRAGASVPRQPRKHCDARPFIPAPFRPRRRQWLLVGIAGCSVRGRALVPS